MKPCCKCNAKIDTGKVICSDCHNEIIDGWTSILEEMPPDNVQVLCYTKAGYFVLDMREEYFYNKHVIYWRYLPNAPIVN